MPGKKRYWTEHPDESIRRLEEIRERLGCSMRDMAEALDVRFRTYQKWVYGTQSPRHPAALVTRAEGLVKPRRLNCWDYLDCGRGPGGRKALANGGVCPAVSDALADGVNSGTNGGRVCWAISGTFCGSRPQGTDSSKLLSCFSCGFFGRVMQEEGLANFKLLKPGQAYVQE